MGSGLVKRRSSRAAVTLLILAWTVDARAADRISWDEAEKHVGEEVTVQGRVLGVRCSQLSCLLAFDPSLNRFTAVVEAENFKQFPPDKLDGLYSGKQVAVHGKIVLNDKKPEIILRNPQDITLTVAERKRAREEDRASRARAQAEMLERIDAVLGRLTDLTERMATVQDRMETLLSELEQRNAALASALASQAAPPPPPAPSYGEPQPRPAYEALRTVKRGMSRNDVQRLIGDPIAVEDTGAGWSTWYYGLGRSVTFDTRGRAQSMVGFPTP